MDTVVLYEDVSPSHIILPFWLALDQMTLPSTLTPVPPQRSRHDASLLLPASSFSSISFPRTRLPPADEQGADQARRPLRFQRVQARPHRPSRLRLALGAGQVDSVGSE